MMGSLARLDDYLDPMTGLPTGGTIAQPEPPQDPAAFTADWARISGQHPQAFEPQGTQWPQYPPPPPKEVPEDKPNPLIPFSAYRSKPPTHRVGDIAAQNIIEQGFGALPAGRLGMGAAFTMDSSPAESASLSKLLSATGVQDAAHLKFSPWTHHRIADRRFERPMYEIPVKYSGKFPDTNIVKPEWLEGAVMTPLVGDPTMSGKIIHSIDNIPLSTPLETRGGHGYIRETEGYANDKGMASAIANRVKDLQREFDTDRIIGTHTKMGAQSGDFSHHVWGSLARMLPASPITKEGRAALDEAIKARIAAIPETPAMVKAGEHHDWPNFAGVNSQRLEQQLASQPDAFRKAFINEMAAQHGKIAGVPNVGAVRYATTDPNLLFAPASSSGLSMTQLTGEIRPGTHPDFPRHLEGKGNFSLGGLLRQEVMFPDIVKRFDKSNYDEPSQWLRKMYMPPEGVPHGQKLTPKWVDNTSGYIEDAEQMGELAAFDKYRRNVLKWK